MKSSSNKQKGYFQSNSKTYEEQLASLQKTMKQLEKGLELSRKEFASSKLKWETEQTELTDSHESTVDQRLSSKRIYQDASLEEELKYNGN